MPNFVDLQGDAPGQVEQGLEVVDTSTTAK